MMPVLLLVYGVGLLATAFCVFQNRVFARSYLVNVCSVVLWPAYWSLFLTLLVLNRTRATK